ncbi:MAG TPA: respiratory nitrate reductase subunit gamma [Pyrinomonadaceae bacterium]|nr:respiratory nitrate reductase subunit gamma [Pyrinomonadaceae bacterium]
MWDNLFFIVLPYVAVTLFVVVSIYRFVTAKFSYSSLSSQLLEGDELFYGVVPWHIGIIGALTGHLIGFLFPKEVLWFNGVPVRLYILETTGLVFGLLALIGIVALIWRRIRMPRIRAVTSTIDTIILVLLFAQVVLGVYTALFYRWGSSWFAASAVPYLRSLFLFQPDVEMIKPLPHIVKTHIINAFLLIAIFPFSRLVHMVSLPVEYLWRPYQVVIWNWNRKKIRGQYPRTNTEPNEDRREKPIGTATTSR